jgi:Fe-S-cluster containining protein
MSPCQNCHAGCCRSFAVPITGADIFRIASQTGRGFWDFVCRWADPDGVIARNHAPQFRFADEPETPFVICLLTDESRLAPGTTKCRFLAESPADADAPLGRGNCSIHGARPATCRAFPTKLSPEGDFAVLYQIGESGRQGSPMYSLCPRPWTPADLDPISHVQDLVVATYEMRYFHRLAAIWNEQPGDWNLFPDFLELVYSSRIQPAEAVASPADDSGSVSTAQRRVA